MNTPLTPDLIRNALSHIPANLSRDEWARIGMAIKSEYPDDIGRDLFMDWSSSVEGFDQKAAQSTWQSVKAGGGVGVGTLLHQAKQNGFIPPKLNEASTKPDSEAMKRMELERAQRRQLEDERTESNHSIASNTALEQWEAASETGSSHYLDRKGVKPFGVRFDAYSGDRDR